MKFNKLYLLRGVAAILLAVSVLAGCKDDENPSFNKQNLIGQWKVVKLVYKNGTDVFLAFDDIDDCQKDNVFEFTESEHIIVYSNELKCEQNEPEVIDQGEWEWGDGKKFIMTLDGDQIEFTVVELSSSKFSIKGTADALGVTLDMSITFQAYAP